jgi:hypothetical protein
LYRLTFDRKKALKKKCMVMLTVVALTACNEKKDDGKHFIGSWERQGGGIQRLEIAPNGENFVVTEFKDELVAPQRPPVITLNGTYPAVVKNGLLEFSHSFGTTTIDVLKESDELIYAGSRYKRSDKPRPCSAEDKSCIYMPDFYRATPQFRERFHDALAKASIIPPTWVPDGVTEPNIRKIVNGQSYLYGVLHEPHNAFHVMYIGYNESRQQVFGFYVNDQGDRIPFGVTGEPDPCKELSRNSCGE